MYNEEENIERLIKLIEEQGPKNYKIIVVNDGSTDNTLQILEHLSKSYPIIIVNHANNQGLSVTVKDVFLVGIKYAKPNDIFLTLDGDMSHNPKFANIMVNCLVNENCDLVIASRFVKGSNVYGVTFLRKILSWGIRILFIGLGVKDKTCGFRAYSYDITNRLVNHYGKNNFITSKGFEVQLELLIKLSKITTLKLKEIPFDLRYDLKKGKSKLKIFRTIKLYLILLFKYYTGHF